MKVKLTENYTNAKVLCKISIVRKAKEKLPSINEGWRFNFNKHSRKKHYETYIITRATTPDIIEGCLIINTQVAFQVYMAFVEVAPHNRGQNKKLNKVAGYLIAYACRQSFVKGKEGYLAFDVLEKDKVDEIRLMNLYSKKYNAVRLNNSTTMIILPEGSEKLIDEFLN